jgi:hypothetical protein
MFEGKYPERPVDVQPNKRLLSTNSMTQTIPYQHRTLIHHTSDQKYNTGAVINLITKPIYIRLPILSYLKEVVT